MTEWIEIVKKVRPALMELDSGLPQCNLTTTFLHGLTPSYDSVVDIILYSRGRDANGRLPEPNVDDVCDKALDTELRQKTMAADSRDTEPFTAAAATIRFG